MTRVYVAASSHELDRVEQVQSAIRAAGMIITHDWCAAIRYSGQCGANVHDDVAAQIARTDLDGVAAADVCIFLAPSDTSKMAWLELGFAMANGTPCIVAHDDEAKRKQSIALRLCVPCADADIVATVERLTTKRSSLVAAMAHVRFLAGQVASHAAKLERAVTVSDVQCKSEQIVNDLKFIADAQSTAMHAFLWKCMRRAA